MFATQQQQHGLFTGVKCISQCNRPLGYIYFPAKEPAQFQDERVHNTHNPVSLMLLGGAHKKAQLTPGSCQRNPAISTFWPRRTATLFLLETAVAEKLQLLQSVIRGSLRQSKAATPFQQCIRYISALPRKLLPYFQKSTWDLSIICFAGMLACSGKP